MPSLGEVEEHCITHLPYLSWCRHCVRGKTKQTPHLKQEEKPTVPEFHLDFCFLGDEDGSKTLTTLVVRERLSRMTMSAVLPAKGRGVHSSKRVVAFMREVGCEHCTINVKCDQEEAMKSLVTDVGKWRAEGGGQQMNVEHSPVYSSSSN
jgi:hypothetical protein